MNYTKMLLDGVKLKDKSNIHDIPLLIHTIDATYPLAFIDFEEYDGLGINYTSENGTEKFVVINKKHIVDIEVIYQDDIHIFTTTSQQEQDIMYQ